MRAPWERHVTDERHGGKCFHSNLEKKLQMEGAMEAPCERYANGTMRPTTQLIRAWRATMPRAMLAEMHVARAAM